MLVFLLLLLLSYVSTGLGGNRGRVDEDEGGVTYRSSGLL